MTIYVLGNRVIVLSKNGEEIILRALKNAGVELDFEESSLCG